MKTKITILSFGILVLSYSIGSYGQNVQDESLNAEIKENLAKEAKLESSFVCYVNNSYMGKKQIPVKVEGKTYYGCCEGCVDKLKNIRDIRYATDPLTGKEVDKATAYIVLKPNGFGEVLYFESEENYLKYF